MEKTRIIDKIVDNLSTLHPLISKSFSKQLRSKTNLNPGSLFIMGLLNKYHTLTMSEIGRKLSMPKPHVTVLVDKLIEEKLVERIPDTNDRRIINIHITPKGESQYEIVKREITEEMRNKIRQLTDHQIEQLAEASETLKELLVLSFNVTSPCDHSKK
ncbi:MAG: MarR family winged helix-turn-helix transcriptional regulator [Microbacter sp.]